MSDAKSAAQIIAEKIVDEQGWMFARSVVAVGAAPPAEISSKMQSVVLAYAELRQAIVDEIDRKNCVDVCRANAIWRAQQQDGGLSDE